MALFSTIIKKLDIKNGKINGVHLANGTFIPADLGKLKKIDKKE